MTGRLAGRLTALAGLAILAVAMATALARAESRRPAGMTRPNIIVVMTDDQPVESMRVMKNVNALLGSKGMTFESSIVSLSLCCPSRATFLTGRYAHNTGVWSNAPPDGGLLAFQGEEGSTLATWLKANGYQTAFVGKYLNGYGPRLTKPEGVPPGWDRWTAAWGPSTYSFFHYELVQRRMLVRHGSTPSDYKTDVLTNAALDAIRAASRAKSKKPFFLWLAYNAPHTTIPEEGTLYGFTVPAPRHAGRFAKEPLPMDASFNEPDTSDKPGAVRRAPLNASDLAYLQKAYRLELESLLAVDEGVARLVQTLRARRLLSNTVIIFTSDNGYLNGEHRWIAAKVLPYEPSIRVPLIVRGPGIAAKTTSRQLVANIDLAPTILALAGARARVPTDGISLVPFLKDPSRSIERGIVIESPHKIGFAGIRTSRYLYVSYKPGVEELYDLQSDPLELENAAGAPAYAGVLEQLRAELDRLRTCAGRSCR